MEGRRAKLWLVILNRYAADIRSGGLTLVGANDGGVLHVGKARRVGQPRR